MHVSPPPWLLVTAVIVSVVFACRAGRTMVRNYHSEDPPVIVISQRFPAHTAVVATEATPLQPPGHGGGYGDNSGHSGNGYHGGWGCRSSGGGSGGYPAAAVAPGVTNKGNLRLGGQTKASGEAPSHYAAVPSAPPLGE